MACKTLNGIEQNLICYAFHFMYFKHHFLYEQQFFDMQQSPVIECHLAIDYECECVTIYMYFFNGWKMIVLERMAGSTRAINFYLFASVSFFLSFSHWSINFERFLHAFGTDKFLDSTSGWACVCVCVFDPT